MRNPRCPLCDAPVSGDEELRGHLASVHELEDDPGVTTQVGQLDKTVPAEAAVAVADPVVLRVHDPDADDERWRPIVIGVGGVMLLVLAVIALSLSL